MLTVGIVGNGVVGGAIGSAYKSLTEVRVHDVAPERSSHSLADVLARDVVFLCLPTPSNTDGSCCISVIEGVLEQARGHTGAMVLKSTVPPGTTDRLAAEYGLTGLVHSPEFLTARTASDDFLNAQWDVVGRPESCSRDAWAAISEAFWMIRKRYPIECSARTSEMLKYMLNGFYAVKVSYFNECFRLAKKLGVYWPDLIELACKFGWLHPMHTQVPGPDGKLGFGGACLPKDAAAFERVHVENGLEPFMLRAAQLTNREIRGE